MKGLTARQREVLEYISEFITANGYAPTYAEIGDHFGFKKSAALAHVEAIAAKGYVKRVPRIARSLALTQKLVKSPPVICGGVYGGPRRIPA